MPFALRTYHTLCITILASHGQIQTERIRIDDINVTGFRATQGIDASIEGFVGVNLNSNTGIFAVDRN